MTKAGVYLMLADDYLFRFRTDLLCFSKRLVDKKTGVAFLPGTTDYGQYFQPSPPVVPGETPRFR